MNYESEHPGSRTRSPAPPLRTTQSMYQSPTAAPQHQPLRRVATSPAVYQPPPVYGPDPNLIYGAPTPPAPIYGPPLPYAPQYSPNTSMYYPPPVPPQQMIMPQPQMAPAYHNYDPNFEAYFGPDVRPQSAQSPIEEQRRQFENYRRSRPSNQSRSAEPATSEAEARALEEAIELSLTESARRGSVSQPSDSGHTSRTNSTRSNDAWDGDSIVPGSNMTPEELADERALQEAILASIREAELEQERDSKLPDDYDEDLCIVAALRDSKNTADFQDYDSHQRAPLVPVLAMPVDRQYPYNLDSERAVVSTERTNFSIRPLPPAPSTTNNRYEYEDREFEDRDYQASRDRSASAYRRRTQQPPQEYAADYPEQPRRLIPREEAYRSPRREYPDVDPRAALPPYESPRRDYPDNEPRRSTPGYDSREGGLVRQAQQSAQRYQLTEETAYDRPKLNRRNSPGQAAYEEATRRPSAGRDFVEKEDYYRSPLSARDRDVYEAERYPAMRRNAEDERRFDNRAALARDYQDTDNYPSRPYPDARSGVMSPPQYSAEHRSNSAARVRPAPPDLWEGSDIPREYHQQDPRRLASNNNLNATTKASYYGASSDAAARYDAYGKDLPARNGPSRQTSRGSNMYFDSPRTGSEGSSAEEEELLRTQSATRGAPPGYDRTPPPVFGHATLRAPTPPPKHLLSGVKYT
eukprot:gene11795-13690_t